MAARSNGLAAIFAPSVRNKFVVLRNLQLERPLQPPSNKVY
jgi:hypothetical protein